MIGENIKQARLVKGFSLQDLEQLITEADRVDGLDAAVIEQIESGQRKVASHELAEFADVLEVTTRSLLGHTEMSLRVDVHEPDQSTPSNVPLDAVTSERVEPGVPGGRAPENDGGE